MLAATLDQLLTQADEIADAATRDGLPPPLVAQVGLAGVVAELAQHVRGRDLAARLGDYLAGAMEEVSAPPGLMYGRMGVALALQAALPPGAAAPSAVLPDTRDAASESRLDVSHGIAGLGLGYLQLAASPGGARPGAAALADTCADRLRHSADELARQLASLPPQNPLHAISIADGFAHGRAGVAHFLLAHGSQRHDADSLESGVTLLESVAGLVPALAAGAMTPTARPMCASWCQGLAGIGTALVRGAALLGENRYLDAARLSAGGCLAIAPRVPLVTQCCGLAGIGEFLLDLFVVTGEARYRDNACQILELMMLRSGGSPTAPRFPGSNLVDPGLGWGVGAAGIVSFLRRLADPLSPRLWIADPGLGQVSPASAG